MRSFVLLSALSGLLFAAPVFSAHASSIVDEHEPLDDESTADWDHVEVSMGFLAGERSYEGIPFAYQGKGDIPGSGELIEPFKKAPFKRTTVLGLRYDLRLVVSYVRMTVGFDLPFHAFRSAGSSGTYEIDGEPYQVSVQSLKAYGLRFGIGTEYPIGPVAPFADLLGGVHWVNTDLSVGGSRQRYASTHFAFSGRGGIRLHVRKWFYAVAAGEVGIAGDVIWGAELSVGFALM